jgi:hypothetical protein
VDFRRVGLIINPVAGKGYASNATIARQVVQRLEGAEFVAGPGQMGAAVLEECGLAGEVVDLEQEFLLGGQRTQALALEMARRDLSALVVVGGDGTMADVGFALVSLEDPPPVLGVGTGSTNVGTLITCRAAEVGRLNPQALRPQPLDALLAYLEGELLGVGFNDCVLGFTVVATVEGRPRDVAVAPKMKGRNVLGKPRPIGRKETVVVRTGPGGIQEIGRGEQVATVVVGLAEANFVGKALTGGVCLAALAGAPAGCLVADQPLVTIEIDRKTVLDLPPLRSTYVSLDESRRIEIGGVRRGTGLCVDGTPLHLLTPEEKVSFGVRCAALRALRLGDKEGQ